MKIKPEYEEEMLLKITKEIDEVLMLLAGIDLNISLSNYDEIVDSEAITVAYKELVSLKRLISIRTNKKEVF